MSDNIQTIKCYLNCVFRNKDVVSDINQFVWGYSANTCLSSYVCALAIHSIMSDERYDATQQLSLLSCINDTFAGRCYLSTSKANYKFYNGSRDKKFGENSQVLKSLITRLATRLKTAYEETNKEKPFWFDINLSYFRNSWASNTVKEAKVNTTEHLWKRIFRWLKNVYYDSNIESIPNVDKEVRDDELSSIAELCRDERNRAIRRRSKNVLSYLFSATTVSVSHEAVAAYQALLDFFELPNLRDVIQCRKSSWQQCLFLMHRMLQSFSEHNKKAFALWPVSNPTIKHIFIDEKSFVELIVNKRCGEEGTQEKVSYKDCVYTVDGRNKHGRRKRTKAVIENDVCREAKRARVSKQTCKTQDCKKIPDCDKPATVAWTYEDKCSLWNQYAEGLLKKIPSTKKEKRFNFSFTTNGHDISLHFAKPKKDECVAKVLSPKRYDRIYGIDPGKIKLFSTVDVLNASPEQSEKFVSVKSKNFRHATQQVHRNEYLRAMKQKHGIKALETFAENVRRKTGVYEEFERYALQQTSNLKAFINFYRRKSILSLKFKNKRSKERELTKVVKHVLSFDDKKRLVRKLKREQTYEIQKERESVLIGFGDGDKKFFNASKGWQSGPLLDLERKIKNFKTPYFNITFTNVNERYTSQNCSKCFGRKTMKFEKEEKEIDKVDRKTKKVTFRTKVVQSREGACQSCGLRIDRDDNGCYNIGVLAKLIIAEGKAGPKSFGRVKNEDAVGLQREAQSRSFVPTKDQTFIA